MPLYMDIHKIPEGAEEELIKAHLKDIAIQDQFGANCQTYWLNKTSGTANCLIEAPSAEHANALHKAAHGMEAAKVIEVNKDVVEAFLGQIDKTEAALDPATTQVGSAIRIILFTDIVGSTKMTQTLGDEGAMHVLNDHDTIVRNALSKNGGREIKHTGDGIMASFTSVAGSIKCAMDIQQKIFENEHENPQINLQVKIGLSVGEPVEKNNDLFGTAVQLAARICDHARADQILITHTVKDLCLGKGFKFASEKDILFKGFTEPTILNSVIWQGN